MRVPSRVLSRPEPDDRQDPGQVLNEPNGQSDGVDPGSAQYDGAAKACESLQPPGLGSSTIGLACIGGVAGNAYLLVTIVRLFRYPPQPAERGARA